MNYAIAVVLLLLLGILTLVSYVDRLYSEIGKFLSREFQNNIDAFEQKVEPRLGVGRTRASLSMALLTQITIATIAMVIGFAVFRDWAWTSHEILQGTLSLILIIIVFNRFLPFVFFARTTGAWLTRWTLLLRALIYLVLPVTLVLGFLQSVTALTREHIDEAPETQAEAVDALLEAGQEEGILDESNRDLIQSVVEFGEKTVREAMKPRPEIVAVPTNTTVEQLIELLRVRPFSRVPVYENTIHNIKGIVYAQDVLQIPDTEAGMRTVDTLMRRDVYFVPESKLGSDLLREMQKNNIRMAVVVDEYGGVAGLVTIEDVLEQIVGDIADEYDFDEGEDNIIRQDDAHWRVKADTEIADFNEALGTDFSDEDYDTIGGLVLKAAGQLPKRNERFQIGEWQFTVLRADSRRLYSLLAERSLIESDDQGERRAT